MYVRTSRCIISFSFRYIRIYHNVETIIISKIVILNIQTKFIVFLSFYRWKVSFFFSLSKTDAYSRWISAISKGNSYVYVYIRSMYPGDTETRIDLQGSSLRASEDPIPRFEQILEKFCKSLQASKRVIEAESGSFSGISICKYHLREEIDSYNFFLNDSSNIECILNGQNLLFKCR